MNNKKYIILDYGKVLADTVTENWFITPNFYNILKTDKIDMDKFSNALIKADSFIASKMTNEEEELKAFSEVYYCIINELGYKSRELANKIAFDFVYNDKKHKLYNDVKSNLERLSKKYTLIMLSDNWPCVYRLMKNWDIDRYFSKIYVSSVYNSQKRNGVFFDYPIKDFNIKEGEAVFIDDNVELLKIAQEKGLQSILMDRENKIRECGFKIIRSLNELE